MAKKTEGTTSTTNPATATDAPTRKEKRSASETLKSYRDGYNGRPAYTLMGGYAGASLNCGDDTATALRMFEPARVLAIAEDVLPGIAKGELATRYAKLNPGMIRMNCGNRIRAAIKKGTITKAALKRAMKAA